MAEEKDHFGNETEPEASEKKKRQWALNALTLAGVFLLGVVLPPEYKAFAPLLFVVPFIINVANKIRQDDANPGNTSQDHAYSPPVPEYPEHTPEPYSYKPRDPKDPRKYKPIG